MKPSIGATGNMGQYRPKNIKPYPVQGRGTLQDLPRSVVRPIPPAYRDEFGRRVRPGQPTVRDDLMKAIVTSKQKGMDAMKGRGY